MYYINIYFCLIILRLSFISSIFMMFASTIILTGGVFTYRLPTLYFYTNETFFYAILFKYSHSLGVISVMKLAKSVLS